MASKPRDPHELIRAIIAEHVLRQTASAPTITGTFGTNKRSGNQPLRARNLPVVTNHTPTSSQVDPPAVGKKPSPTPSHKRAKVERLVKEHGSPPGMRVTAGGRIVPNDLPSLPSPEPQDARHFSSSSYHFSVPSHPPHFAHPGSSFIPYMVPSSSGEPAIFHSVDGSLPFDQHSQPFQKFEGLFMPCKSENGLPHFHFPGHSEAMPAPIQSTAKPASHPRQQKLPIADYMQARHLNSAQPTPPSGPRVTAFEGLLYTETVGMDSQAQLDYLEKKYKQMQHELRDLERTEVLQSDRTSSHAKELIVTRKREYVINCDAVRKLIKEVKVHLQTENKGQQSTDKTNTNSLLSQQDPKSFANRLMTTSTVNPYDYPSYVTFPNVPQVRSSFPTQQMQMIPVSHAPGSPDTVIGSTTAHASQGTSRRNRLSGQGLNPSAQEYTGPSRSAKTSPNVNKTSNTRKESRAVEIKDPATLALKNFTNFSALDPKSATYEPTHQRPDSNSSPTGLKKDQVSQDQATHNVDRWLFDSQSPESPEQEKNALRLKSSNESSTGTIATIDFFPHDPHEHSLNRHKYPTAKPTRAFSGGRSQSKVTQSLEKQSQNISKPMTEARNGVPNELNHPHTPSFEKIPEYRSDLSETSSIKAKGASIDRTAIIKMLEKHAGKSAHYLDGVSAGVIKRPITNEILDAGFIQGYCAGLLQANQYIADHGFVPKEKSSLKNVHAQPSLHSIRESSRQQQMMEKQSWGSVRGATTQIHTQHHQSNHENHPIRASSSGSFWVQQRSGNRQEHPSVDTQIKMTRAPGFPQPTSGNQRQASQTHSIRDTRSDESTKVAHEQTMRMLQDQLHKSGYSIPASYRLTPGADRPLASNKSAQATTRTFSGPPLKPVNSPRIEHPQPVSNTQSAPAHILNFPSTPTRGVTTMQSWPREGDNHRRWPSNLDGTAERSAPEQSTDEKSTSRLNASSPNKTTPHSPKATPSPTKSSKSKLSRSPTTAKLKYSTKKVFGKIDHMYSSTFRSNDGKDKTAANMNAEDSDSDSYDPAKMSPRSKARHDKKWSDRFAKWRVDQDAEAGKFNKENPV